MYRIVNILFLLTFAAWPRLSQAQIYVCKDNAGKTITSDRPIAECAARPMRELGNNGVTRREIPAPLTIEQKRQKQIEEDRHKAEAEALLEMRRRDQAIIERFGSEKDIHSAHERAAQDIQERIRRELVLLSFAERKLKEIALQESHQKATDATPLLPSRRFEEASKAVATRKDIVQQYKAQQIKVDLWFDETLKRYRDLTGPTATR